GKPWWRRWFGSRSERAAARFLKRQGFRILARNFTCDLGELDLIALDGNCIVFAEVRSTETHDDNRPAESVDLAKQKRLSRLALYYLQKKRLLNHSARFDVLSISWPEGCRQPTIQHIKNAFEAVGDYQV
ncbi:MAG: YraN family protein, partial [Gemmataceae bacterium]|nr:YraN family protein [Gemmataceae bacterium]